MNITNHTESNLDEFIEVVKRFMPFAQKQIGFNRPPTIDLISDSQNAQSMMGKTAFYDPAEVKVVVYIDGRHPKDMLRSISHELVHHAQNCNGEFDNSRPLGEDYAQTDPHLRNMEEDANLRGNMCVRDFVDQKLHLEESKRRTKNMANEKQLREAIRKIIIEDMDVNDTPYNRDDELPGDELEVELGSEEEAPGYSLGPNATAEEMLSLVARFVEEQGIETAPPGMTDAGIAATKDYLKGDWRRGKKVSAAEKDAEADFAAASDADAEEEEAVVGEALLNLVKEGRRRRRRRAAALKAQRAGQEATPAPPAPEKAAPAPKVKKKKVEPARNHRPDVEEPKKVIKENTDKEWYEGELFSKLRREAVK